jgi:dihydrofolate reductase
MVQPSGPPVTAVVAITPCGVIGDAGTIPWRLGQDLRRFKRLTLGGVLVMGRKTFESIGRPLPGRQTVVLSRDPEWSAQGVQVAASPATALRLAGQLATAHAGSHSGSDADTPPAAPPGTGHVFVVGGAEVYRQLLPQCRQVYLTRVLSEVPGETRLKLDLSGFRVIERSRVPAGLRDEVPTEFSRLVRIPPA